MYTMNGPNKFFERFALSEVNMSSNKYDEVELWRADIYSTQ